MKILAVLRILIVSIFCILNKHTTGASSTTEDASSGSKAFSCAGKVIGGYYADVQEKCQMFHVCTIGENEEIRDIVFRCLNGTVFDQETRVCEREEEVNCAIAQSFFHLNNDLYGPGIIPETATALKHVLGQTERQIKLESDKETTTRDANSLCSGLTKEATLMVDVESGCQFLQLCLPQQDQGYAVQTFVCGDKNHVFDPITKLCTKKQAVHCDGFDHSISSSLRETEFFSTYLLNLCPLFPPGSLMIDSLNGCEQYFECPLLQYSDEPIVMKRCAAGHLFSQVHQKCVPDGTVVCARDLYSLLKLFKLKSTGLLKDNSYKHINIKSLAKLEKAQNNINIIPRMLSISRKKRAFTFEDRNLHRELASGSLTNAAGIFNDHVSVIEAQGPGNIVEGKINNPKFPLIVEQSDRFKNKKSVAPETSLELNKTVLNGATIEVSKIASPDHKGEVTITSIVPKLVRHNGNGHKTERSDDEVSPNPTIISNGKTKITLLGSNHGVSDGNKETINEQVDPTNSTLVSDVTDKSERDTSIQTEFPENEMESVTDLVTDIAPETTVANLETTEKPEAQTTLSTTPSTTTTTTESPTTTTTTTTTVATTTTSTTTTTPSTTSLQPESSTKEEKVETNFTCKDKELEQFYPDIEKDCKLFHYCSPGFSENEVLDLTFVCSNDTRFDVRTNKCQEMSTVICGKPPSTTVATTSSTSSEPSSSSVDTTVSSSTTAATSSSTSTLESTTTTSEVLVSSSTNVQTVSEAVEDSTMTLSSSSEGLELSGISTISEDQKADSTESIISESEGSTSANELRSEKIELSTPKATDSGVNKRDSTDVSDSSIITEMVTEGTEKEHVISSTVPSKVSDPTEITAVDNPAGIIASDDLNKNNKEESSTIAASEKLSQGSSSSDENTDSILASTTEVSPEGTAISNLDSGTSIK